MATHDPDSHAAFELLSDGHTVGFSPCSYSVDLTIVDHRPTAAADEGFWKVMIQCPNSCNSADDYRSFIKDVVVEICTRCLNLRNCCAADLVPDLIQVLAGDAHTCGHLHSLQLHVFPCTVDHPSIAAVLSESFEAAQPRTTPASRAWIEKIVAEKEGDDSDVSSSSSSCSSSDVDRSCMICLDDEIIPPRSSLEMPCSHIFHESCIVEWLKVSHVCPLCRYEMPVDNADNSDYTYM